MPLLTGRKAELDRLMEANFDSQRETAYRIKRMQHHIERGERAKVEQQQYRDELAKLAAEHKALMAEWNKEVGHEAV